MSIVLVVVVDDLEAVLAAGYTHLRVYRAPTPGGTYAALGTVALAVGRRAYQYADATGDEEKWYKVTRWSATQETPLSAAVPLTGYPMDYCTLGEVRAEGVTSAVISDGRALEAIRAAAEYVDLVTGQWFYPRALSLTLPGIAGPLLQVPHPIIAITRCAIMAADGTEADIALEDLRVYNRHLTQGVRDDAYNPRLELRGWMAAGIFGNGNQAVRLDGVFGWTEPLRGAFCGETAPNSQRPLSYGETPRTIRRAALGLALREMFTRYGDADLREDLRNRWNLQAESTKDQSYSKGTAARRGAYTGDVEIDDVLAGYQIYSGMAVA